MTFGVSCSPSAALPPGNSVNNNDIVRFELKKRPSTLLLNKFVIRYFFSFGVINRPLDLYSNLISVGVILTRQC